MITNVGLIDRTVRLAAAFGLLGWDGGYFGPPLPGISSLIVWGLGMFPLITGGLRWCPILAAANISTCTDER